MDSISILDRDTSKPRVFWKDEETRILLKSWKDNMHRLIENGCKKKPLYFMISKDLLKHGYRRSMREVNFKMQNLRRSYRNAKKCMAINGEINFLFYKEVDELLKMEANIYEKKNPTSEPHIIPETEQHQIVLDGSYVEENAFENSNNVQVIRLEVPESQGISDLNPPSYTVITRAEPEVQNNHEVMYVTLPESSSSSSQKTSENIFLNFYKEFERSNRQLEKNDAEMLELFKEQNDIFRTQTTLLMKLLLK